MAPELKLNALEKGHRTEKIMSEMNCILTHTNRDPIINKICQLT